MNGDSRTRRQFGKNPWFGPKHFLMIYMHFESSMLIAKDPRMRAICVQCDLGIWFNGGVPNQLACIIYPIHVNETIGGIGQQQEGTFNRFL